MELDIFKARYEGLLAKVSKDKAFGFVDPVAIQLCWGEQGDLPDDSIFFHAHQLEHTKCLENGYFVSFRIRPSKKHEGKFEATAGRFHPRICAPVTAVSARGDYGFFKSYDLEIAPEHASAFSNGVPDDALPKEDVFAHISKLTGESGTLSEGRRMTFLPRRVASGPRSGKMQAMALRTLR